MKILAQAEWRAFQKAKKEWERRERLFREAQSAWSEAHAKMTNAEMAWMAAERTAFKEKPDAEE